MSLKPMYDNILIDPIKAQEKSAGGIYLAEADRSKPYAEGVVREIGVGYKTPDGSVVPLRVKVGDTVLYRKGVEMAVNVEGEDLFLISEGVIFAVRG